MSYLAGVLAYPPPYPGRLCPCSAGGCLDGGDLRAEDRGFIRALMLLLERPHLHQDAAMLGRVGFGRSALAEVGAVHLYRVFPDEHPFAVTQEGV